MRTIDTPDSINAGRFIDHHGPALVVAAAVLSMLCVAMSVNAKDVPAPQPQRVAAVEAVSAASTLSEQAWNEREDFKAGNNVGLPGIY